MSRSSLAIAAAATLMLSACGDSHVAAQVRGRGTDVKAQALTITAPLVLLRYHLREGTYMVGTRPPVTGVLLTDDPDAHRSGGGFSVWSDPSSEGPPANKVALILRQGVDMGPGLPRSALRLHLPLSLRQPWFREHLRNGRNGYRWGYLMVRGQPYEVMFWSGRTAPARDRAAALNALASIRRTR